MPLQQDERTGFVASWLCTAGIPSVLTTYCSTSVGILQLSVYMIRAISWILYSIHFSRKLVDLETSTFETSPYVYNLSSPSTWKTHFC